jgi:hypothetical protein
VDQTSVGSVSKRDLRNHLHIEDPNQSQRANSAEDHWQPCGYAPLPEALTPWLYESYGQVAARHLHYAQPKDVDVSECGFASKLEGAEIGRSRHESNNHEHAPDA